MKESVFTGKPKLQKIGKQKSFVTITIGNICFDMPKKMPIPQKGDIVFVDGEPSKADRINYHVNDGILSMISIYTEKP